MSSYLGFRKDNVKLCYFSRNTKLYQAFDSVPYEDWGEVTPEILRAGITALRDDKEENNKQIAHYQEVLNNLTNYEDIISVVDSINECKEENEAIDYSIAQLFLLIEICNEHESGQSTKFEWKVG